MGARALVTSAGIAASNNLVRSLGAGDPFLEVFGCHDDRFLLKKSPADGNYLLPPSRGTRWRRALLRILRAKRIDLLIPCGDEDVLAVSRVRGRLGKRVFLPPHAVIRLCQDKYRLNRHLRGRGIPVPATYAVGSLLDVDRIFRRFPRRSLLWCRPRTGSGGLGAIPVRNREQARSWILYWQQMRRTPVSAFTLAEYLPGRDFGCQSLWRRGRLILIKTYERLSYLSTGNRPSQVSSIAALAKTVVEPRIVDICTRAVRALDREISGVFSIDLREDARGVPCITEINAGRFSSATNIFDLTGKHNMAVIYVRLARGARIDIEHVYDAVEDYYMLRDLDSPPRIFHAEEFFEGIEDARE